MRAECTSHSTDGIPALKYGGRAEWEGQSASPLRMKVAYSCCVLSLLGFTAVVDKILTKKYDKMVNDAPELIKVLPWGPSFEVDVS